MEMTEIKILWRNSFMPIDPISWVIIGLLAFDTGLIIGAFWDEIKAWFDRMLGYILDGINWAVEQASNAIAYLVKQGTRVYKKIEVVIRNVVTGKYFKRFKEEEISPYDVPQKTMSQLSTNPTLQVYEYRRG
jgi:hypothetical protein